MVDKIKIAFLIDTVASDMAGTEKQLMEVLRRIDRQRFDPRLVCLRSSPWLEGQRLPCPLVVLGYRGFLDGSLPAVIRRFAALIDADGVQIVQTFFEDSMFVGLLGKIFSRRKPVLLASRRDLGLGAEEPWYHALFRLLRPAANRRFDGILVNAEAIRSHVARVERFPAERIRVIPNGVALPRPSGRPAMYDDTQAGLRIVITANLKPVKRHDVFLHAMARLQAACPDLNAHGYLLGEGRLRPELTRLAGSLGVGSRIHFLGARGDVCDFLRHADVGVLCSDREGLSNAILEYMACGLPVVATEAGGNSEIIDEDNGILVPPGDPQALGEALAVLARSPSRRRVMGQASLARIGQVHLWDRVMPQWEEYYGSWCRKT